MARLFDAYIVVDWSAAAKPTTGENSIWVAICTRDRKDAVDTVTFNPPTRLQARRILRDQLRDLIQADKKVLVGFDFAMGNPAGTAAALGLDVSTNAPWAAIHHYLARAVEEYEDNSNARFALAADMNTAMAGHAHPFWGATKTTRCVTLSMKKGDFAALGSLPEHRISETWIRANFKARPKSVWQLTGVGAVGSQALLGVPTVAFLRREIPGAQIWPFETGFEPLTPQHLKNTSCVLAEVYPSTVQTHPNPGEILDEIQVKTLSNHFESLDRTGNLAAAFGPPDARSEREIHKITSEEGWILAK